MVPLLKLALPSEMVVLSRLMVESPMEVVVTPREMDEAPMEMVVLPLAIDERPTDRAVFPSVMLVLPMGYSLRGCGGRRKPLSPTGGGEKKHENAAVPADSFSATEEEAWRLACRACCVPPALCRGRVRVLGGEVDCRNGSKQRGTALNRSGHHT